MLSLDDFQMGSFQRAVELLPTETLRRRLLKLVEAKLGGEHQPSDHRLKEALIASLSDLGVATGRSVLNQQRPKIRSSHNADRPERPALRNYR